MSTPTSDQAGIRQTIRALVADGHTLRGVWDGEENLPTPTETTALDAITAVDDATLTVRLPSGGSGWVRFVMGNDPEEVVCDYTTNLESTLGPLTEGWWS